MTSEAYFTMRNRENTERFKKQMLREKILSERNREMIVNMSRREQK